MRRHAKASSAASTSSSTGTFALLTCLCALALLALAPSALAAKQATDYFGNAELDAFGNTLGGASHGGEFNNPRDPAVNRTGTGPAEPGEIYVADETNNRVQRFDKNGKFISAWGANAIRRDETQRFVVSAEGGTYTLTFEGQTTTPINFNATGSQIATTLAALPAIGAGNVAGSGNAIQPKVITFVGKFAGTDVPQISSDASGLSGSSPAVPIQTVENGSGGGGSDYEICTTAALCGPGMAVGGNGTTAGNGSLNKPVAVAVDNDTGNVFVSDRENRRVSVYDGAGAFIASYGTNVVASGVDNGAEQQKLTVDATGGTFALSFGAVAPTTTGALAFNASAATVQSALEGLGGIGAGNIVVSGPAGGPYAIRFIAARGNVNQANVTTDATLLTGDNPAIAGAGPSAVVAETIAGGVASAYEICRAGTTDICQSGSSGSGVGQYGAGTTAGTYGIAVSPGDSNAATGTIFLADSGNRRVDTYALDGALPASFGSSANFAEAQPRKIAVDSRGIVYASDASNGGEIERYDSLNANGGGTVFLSQIGASVNEAQTITFTGFSTGNTFKLTCPNGEQTNPITYSANGAGRTAIQAALNEKCGAGNINTGIANNPPNVTITFEGAFSQQNVPTTICAVVSGPGSCAKTAEVDGRTSVLLRGSSEGLALAATATAGLAVDPDSDGAGADKDVLQVLRDPETGATVVQQLGPANAPGLTPAPTAVDDTHGESLGLGTANGLSLDEGSGRLYVATSGTAAGVSAATHRVYVLADALPAPTALTNAVSATTATTATFNGTVDPKGGRVSCSFEYSTDLSSWTSVSAPGCGGLSSAGGPQALSLNATGLSPNTHYYLRLTASRPWSAGGATSPVKPFDTSGAAPVLTDLGAVQVTDSSARLVVSIDARNAATAYVFEYGTTPALGSATGPVAIGSGTSPVVLSQVIGGLAKGTTYYFRAAATNAFGTAYSTGKSLTTATEPPPPAPGRKYEQVTPTDKGLVNVDNPILESYKVSVAADGEALAYCYAAGGTQVGEFCGDYISQRGAGGWKARGAAPVSCSQDLEAEEATLGAQKAMAFSADLRFAIVAQPEAVGCGVASLDPAAPLPGSNLYRTSLFTATPAYQLLTPVSSPDTARSFNTGNGTYVGSSEDGSHVEYLSSGDEASGGLPGGATLSTSILRLFEWDAASGQVRLVSVPAAGLPLSIDAKVALMGAAEPTASRGHSYGAVSAAGNRTFFQAPAGNVSGNGDECQLNNCEIYMRENATTTKWVSRQECSPACSDTQAPDRGKWANPAGNRVLFETTAKLVNADTSTTGLDLYLYRDSANPDVDQNLTLLSADNEAGDSNAANVQGVLGMSDDGDTVYFVAKGQLVAGESTAAGFKVYRWSWNGGNPTIRYLATLTGGLAGEEFQWMHSTNNERTLTERVPPDGSWLLLDSLTRLDPVADQDSTRDVYRWSQQGGWLCLSCQVPGTPSSGASDIKALTRPQFQDAGSYPGHPTAGGQAKNGEAIRVASEDGHRVFFTSSDQLTGADTNSVPDVYEWHDGTLSLLSAGTGNFESRLISTDASGRDAFFLTTDRLVGWDTDNLKDIYDARLGGGFPEPPIEPPGCEAEGCRGAGTGPPAGAGAATSAFVGPGNRTKGSSRPCRHGLVKHGKRCVKKKSVKKKSRAHSTRKAR